MQRIKLSNLSDLFNSLSKKEKLYIPVTQKSGGAKFKLYEEGDILTQELNTVRSAKDFFFPQTENLAEFKVEGKNIEIIDVRKETEDFIVFGVRACDLKSFEILDSVYLAEPIDTFYANRRKHGAIFTLACNNPENTCFCKSFGIDATSPKGDVECYMDSENLYLNAITEKGKEILASLNGILEDCNENAVNEVKAEINKNLDNMPLSNLKPADYTDKQLEIFNSTKWEELSKTCMGCGTCTFVCPTCQCYDIKEFNTGNGVKRFRCWDSCMYSDFTQCAHGNPRTTQLQRFRQRFMHKLVYYPANNNGVYGCVGCGRCLKKCPISMNIVKVMKSLAEEN